MIGTTTASPGNPRYVTREDIDAVEQSNKALAGIGKHMEDMGIWLVVENQSPRGCA